LALGHERALGMIPLVIALSLGLVYRPHTEASGDPLGTVGPPILFAIALLIGGISCFSYLGSWTGFHFDTAEHWSNVIDGIRTRHYFGFKSIYRLLPFNPHVYISGLIVEYLGDGLAQYRLLGATECFLMIPVVFLLFRRLLDRTAAAIAALFMAGSLWNFTLSKLAHFAVPVPLTAAVTVGTFLAILSWRRYLSAALLMFITFIIGFNIYDAYRVLFPVLGTMVLAGFILERKKRWHLLLVPAALTAAVALQAIYLDPNFFFRLQQSHLLQQPLDGKVRMFTGIFFGKLFAGTWDIELSPSQGAIDHPVLVALFLLGLALAVGNVRQRWGYILAVWVLIPCSLAVMMEGQWRRVTVMMAAMSGLASLPVTFLIRDLSKALRHRPAWQRTATLAAAMSLIVCAIAANVYRFRQIHAERSGGYYISPQQIQAAKWAAKRCPFGNFIVVDYGRWQVWNLVQLWEEGLIGCFVANENCFDPLYALEELRQALSDAVRNRSHPVFVMVSVIPDTVEIRNQLAALTTRDPPLARQVTTPGTSDLYLTYEVGGPLAIPATAPSNALFTDDHPAQPSL